MVIMIDKEKFINYVIDNQIVWQPCDGLIETGKGSEFSNIIDVAKAISESRDFEIVSRDQMLKGAFHDLAEWSTDTDVLILVSDDVLVCVPKHEIVKFAA